MKKRGERLPRPGRREQKRRLPAHDRRPAEGLGTRRLAEGRSKVRGDRVVEQTQRVGFGVCALFHRGSGSHFALLQ
jgi:hypothetical protein